MTIDALRLCDVVTADGDFIIANERENADLFWALRGGGGNFGIVTNFTFALQPLGPSVLAGAVSRVPAEATAFSNRDAAHDINIVASWLPANGGEPDRHIDWVRRFFSALEPHSRGMYVNFVGDDTGDRIRAAYSDQQWRRLTALKAKYDPTNFFRMNANIPPNGS